MTIVCSGAFSTSQLSSMIVLALFGAQFDYILQSERFTTLNLHIYKQKIIVYWFLLHEHFQRIVSINHGFVLKSQTVSGTESSHPWGSSWIGSFYPTSNEKYDGNVWDVYTWSPFEEACKMSTPQCSRLEPRIFSFWCTLLCLWYFLYCCSLISVGHTWQKWAMFFTDVPAGVCER